MDFTFEQTEQPATTTEREIVPAGTHLMEIKAAEETTNEYKRSEANPEGRVLAIRLAANTGDYKLVYHDLPQHLGWLAQQLAAACGIDTSGGTVSLNAGDLVGRVVKVSIKHYTSKSTGKVSAVVDRYLRATAASKPATRRAPVAKVAEESDDFIPF